ncbi:MAG TPA: VWA domain-containing protein [Candidatus Baltobacteraceae bacterium]|nr:VWA domain-containing protein [Candidatus Baltobacteraceae bacterium]
MNAVVGFVAALRDAGVRISPAESIEALRALDAVGYEHRDVVRDALAVVLAKSAAEKIVFDDCFARYFGAPPRFDAGAAEGEDRTPGRDDALDAGAQASNSAGTAGGPGGGALARMLADGDRGALAAAIEAAAAETRLDIVRYPTQRNMAVQRILERLGHDQLLREIAALRRAEDARSGERAEGLERKRAALREHVRERVDRRLALATPANERRRDESLAAAPLRSLDASDVARMRSIARAMAKRLALRFGRRRKRRRRGLLDVKRTLRRAHAYGGVPFRPAWKHRKRHKTKLVVLCDVSGSVAAIAQFLLLVVYGLTEALDAIRAFAFTGRLFEVSEMFATQPVETAIARVLRAGAFGSSDYGGALTDFVREHSSAVDRRTVVVILGDARSNFGDPRIDLLELLHERAGRLVWLNPEHRSSWGSGDSEMLRYLPQCDAARVCASLADLERAVRDLVAPRR